MLGKIFFTADIGLIGCQTDFQSAALADDLPLPQCRCCEADPSRGAVRVESDPTQGTASCIKKDQREVSMGYPQIAGCFFWWKIQIFKRMIWGVPPFIHQIAQLSHWDEICVLNPDTLPFSLLQVEQQEGNPALASGSITKSGSLQSLQVFLTLPSAKLT